MPEVQKQTYPVIPAKHWWTLRKQFQRSIPSTVTPRFLATTLGMKDSSARTNIIPSLVMMGIIDQEGNPTDRATQWRDDIDYRDVCKDIRNEIYPRELLDAVPGPDIDRSAVERWFASKTGVGQAAANRFAVVYELLTTMAIPQERAKPATPAKPKSSPKPKPSNTTGVSQPSAERKSAVFQGVEPAIHINIQIHISPDAKPDQIDQIFESMAKHLKTLREGNE
ncbi:MAG: DUF5343 domain-containing protein [Chloroflexi bacterium]|nr:DUF5343 domain-containing protein [Chloroflexota bacterium]